jgi:hypothetical protein
MTRLTALDDDPMIAASIPFNQTRLLMISTYRFYKVTPKIHDDQRSLRERPKTFQEGYDGYRQSALRTRPSML